MRVWIRSRATFRLEEPITSGPWDALRSDGSKVPISDPAGSPWIWIHDVTALLSKVAAAGRSAGQPGAPTRPALPVVEPPEVEPPTLPPLAISPPVATRPVKSLP